MSCFSPLSARISARGLDGKKNVKILSKVSGYGNSKLPCGRCIGCRLTYSQDWAVRCMLESKYYKYNYFITLTYNNSNLPLSSLSNPTLNKSHLTKFVKDLRNYYSYHYNHKNIRYFACGEYGSKFKRPHYHLIIFNLPIYDLKVFSRSHSGDVLYNSSLLSSIWKKGFVVVGNVSFESSAYVARYIMKKQIKKEIEKNDIISEYVVMSRMPGIGHQYYLDNLEDIYNSDKIPILTSKSLKYFKPPPYFDRLLEKDNPTLFYKIKDSRFSYMQKNIEYIESKYNVCHSEFIFNRFDRVRKKSKKLQRNLV